MRILVTCFTYVPRRNGVQFVTQYLCEGLAKRGHLVTMLTQNSEGLPERETVNGVIVERWNARTEHLRHKGSKKEYVAYVLDHQDEFDVMLNVCTQSALTDWLLPHLGEIRIPKLLQVHSIWDFEIHPWDRASASSLVRKLVANVRWKLYYHANAQAFRQYDRILQLYEQDYSVADFRKWYGIESVILENAAEDVFHENAPVAEAEKRRSIVCVANYTRQKNQAALIDAFLRADLPRGWSLDLVGSEETPEYARMRRLEANVRAEVGADAADRPVNYHVGISRSETVALVKNASLYAMSSIWEAFPVSLIEAMSAGVPWVSTDVGIAKYLPGGVVVDDVEELTHVIGCLASNEGERIRLGAEGFAYAAAHFRIDNKVTQLERMLREVTGGAR